MKLKAQKRKYHRFPKLANMYQAYRVLLLKDKSFEWSFIKFLWNIRIGSYKLNFYSESEDKNPLFVLILKESSQDSNIMNILYYHIAVSVMVNPELLQALKVQLNYYSFSGYRAVLMHFPSKDAVFLSFIKRFVNFEEEKLNSLIIANNNKTTVLIKKLI